MDESGTLATSALNVFIGCTKLIKGHTSGMGGVGIGAIRFDLRKGRVAPILRINSPSPVSRLLP